MLTLQDQPSPVTGPYNRRRKNTTRRRLGATPPPVLPPGPPPSVMVGTPDDDPPAGHSPRLAMLRARVLAAVERYEADRTPEAEAARVARLKARSAEHNRLMAVMDQDSITEAEMEDVRRSMERLDEEDVRDELPPAEDELRDAILHYTAAMADAEFARWDGRSPKPESPKAFPHGRSLYVVPPGWDAQIVRVSLEGWAGRMLAETLAGR